MFQILYIMIIYFPKPICFIQHYGTKCINRLQDEYWCIFLITIRFNYTITKQIYRSRQFSTRFCCLIVTFLVLKKKQQSPTLALLPVDGLIRVQQYNFIQYNKAIKLRIKLETHKFLHCTHRRFIIAATYETYKFVEMHL